MIMSSRVPSSVRYTKGILYADSGSFSSELVHSGQLVRENTLDWNLEHLNFVRTTSYKEIWMKAQMLTGKRHDDLENLSHSTEFMLGSDSLLDRDQVAVSAMLHDRNKNWNRIEILKLVSDYIETGLKASNLCNTLLRTIEQARCNCRLIKGIVLPCTGESDCNQLIHAIEQLRCISQRDNPLSEPTSQQFRTVNDCHRTMHRRLEEKRKSLENQIRLINCFKSGCAVLLVAAVAGVSISALAIATHAVIVVAIAPFLSLPIKSAKKAIVSLRRRAHLGVLTRQSAQLDAAARGTFAVNRVLDTMACLATRLHDEMEHNKVLIRFGWQHKEDQFSLEEVFNQLWKSLRKLQQHLQELEELVFLCFVLINKARNMVVHEISP